MWLYENQMKATNDWNCPCLLHILHSMAAWGGESVTTADNLKRENMVGKMCSLEQRMKIKNHFYIFMCSCINSLHSKVKFRRYSTWRNYATQRWHMTFCATVASATVKRVGWGVLCTLWRLKFQTHCQMIGLPQCLKTYILFVTLFHIEGSCSDRIIRNSI